MAERIEGVVMLPSPYNNLNTDRPNVALYLTGMDGKFILSARDKTTMAQAERLLKSLGKMVGFEAKQGDRNPTIWFIEPKTLTIEGDDAPGSPQEPQEPRGGTKAPEQGVHPLPQRVEATARQDSIERQKAFDEGVRIVLHGTPPGQADEKDFAIMVRHSIAVAEIILPWIQNKGPRYVSGEAITILLDLADEKGITDDQLTMQIHKDFGPLELAELSPEQGRRLWKWLADYVHPDEPVEEPPAPPDDEEDIPF